MPSRNSLLPLGKACYKKWDTDWHTKCAERAVEAVDAVQDFLWKFSAYLTRKGSGVQIPTRLPIESIVYDSHRRFPLIHISPSAPQPYRLSLVVLCAAIQIHSLGSSRRNSSNEIGICNRNDGSSMISSYIKDREPGKI